MKIKLNDRRYDVAEGMTLCELIEGLDVQLQGIAVAIDYQVIPRSQWRETFLKENMDVMMIHAVSGG